MIIQTLTFATQRKFELRSDGAFLRYDGDSLREFIVSSRRDYARNYILGLLLCFSFVVALAPACDAVSIAVCHADAGETVFVDATTRVEKSAGNEFKIYGLIGSGGEIKECAFDHVCVQYIRSDLLRNKVPFESKQFRSLRRLDPCHHPASAQHDRQSQG